MQVAIKKVAEEEEVVKNKKTSLLAGAKWGCMIWDNTTHAVCILGHSPDINKIKPEC